jgi:hypothetical protein
MVKLKYMVLKQNQHPVFANDVMVNPKQVMVPANYHLFPPENKALKSS